MAIDQNVTTSAGRGNKDNWTLDGINLDRVAAQVMQNPPCVNSTHLDKEKYFVCCSFCSMMFSLFLFRIFLVEPFLSCDFKKPSNVSGKELTPNSDIQRPIIKGL